MKAVGVWGEIYHKVRDVVAAYAHTSTFKELGGLEVVVVEVWGDKDRAETQIEAFRQAMDLSKIVDIVIEKAGSSLD